MRRRGSAARLAGRGTVSAARCTRPAPIRVQGSGFRVQGSGFRVQGSGFSVQGPGFKVQGSGFRVQSSGRLAGRGTVSAARCTRPAPVPHQAISVCETARESLCVYERERGGESVLVCV